MQLFGQLIGPTVVGLLIVSSIALPFGVNASVYALSFVLIWLIALPQKGVSVTTRFVPALLEGFDWMRCNPTILGLSIMLGAINAVFAGEMTIFVLYPSLMALTLK